MEKAEEVYSVFLIRYLIQNKVDAVDTLEVCKDVRKALIPRLPVYHVAKHVFWLQGGISAWIQIRSLPQIASVDSSFTIYWNVARLIDGEVDCYPFLVCLVVPFLLWNGRQAPKFT